MDFNSTEKAWYASIFILFSILEIIFLLIIDLVIYSHFNFFAYLKLILEQISI